VTANDGAPAPDGSARPTRRTKNIEDIQVGDIVLAMDEETGEMAPKRVIALFRNRSDHLRIVRLQRNDGAQQELRTTDEHPFFVADRGWLEARSLSGGDEVIESSGGVSTVLAIEREEHRDGIEVFNFEVEDYHTYFVAQDESAAAIFVHNRCNNPYGRRGSPLHRARISAAETRLTARGWKTSSGGLGREARVDIPGTGRYRYPPTL